MIHGYSGTVWLRRHVRESTGCSLSSSTRAGRWMWMSAAPTTKQPLMIRIATYTSDMDAIFPEPVVMVAAVLLRCCSVAVLLPFIEGYLGKDLVAGARAETLSMRDAGTRRLCGYAIIPNIVSGSQPEISPKTLRFQLFHKE